MILCCYFYRKEFQYNEIKKYIEKKDYEKVIKVGEEVLKKTGGDYSLYYYLGKAYEEFGQNKHAIEKYEKALIDIQKYSRSALKLEILIKLGNLYQKIEDYETSSGYFKMILAEFPNNPTALFNLGKIYYEKKDFLKSKSYLEKFITLKHDKCEAYLLLSKCFYNLENYQKAFDYLSLWFEKNNNISNEIYNENIIFLSDIYFNLKKFQEAINTLKQLLEEENFIKDALLRMIKTYIKMNKFDKATELANDYIVKVPKEEKIPILYELANAYVGEKEIYKAIEIWKGIKSFSPRYKDINEILEKYKILDENPILKNYFTSDDSVFSNFIIKNFQIKEFQIYHKNDIFWIVKEENLCHVLYREIIPILPVTLTSIENYLIDEGMSTHSVTLFSLFGADKDCYTLTFFKKIRVVSGEQFVMFFSKKTN